MSREDFRKLLKNRGKIVHKLAAYDSKGNLLCKICRIIIHTNTKNGWKLHLEGEKHLKIFAYLKQKLIKKKEQKKLTTSILRKKKKICENCDESQATFYCEDCGDSICNNCNRDLHKSKKKQAHRRKPLSKPERTGDKVNDKVKPPENRLSVSGVPEDFFDASRSNIATSMKKSPFLVSSPTPIQSKRITKPKKKGMMLLIDPDAELLEKKKKALEKKRKRKEEKEKRRKKNIIAETKKIKQQTYDDTDRIPLKMPFPGTLPEGFFDDEDMDKKMAPRKDFTRELEEFDAIIKETTNQQREKTKDDLKKLEKMRRKAEKKARKDQLKQVARLRARSQQLANKIAQRKRKREKKKENSEKNSEENSEESSEIEEIEETEFNTESLFSWRTKNALSN